MMVSKSKFNFDEWVDSVPKTMRKRGSSYNLDENLISVKVRKHKKKENMYYISFHFRNKILQLIDNGEKPKIIVFKHKDDEERLLLTRSQNGYCVLQPQKQTNYYFFKALLFSKKPLKEIDLMIDPIFHVKGKNSGAVIELNIGDHDE